MSIYAFLHHHPNIASDAYVHPDATVIGEVYLASGVSIWPQAVLRGDMGWIKVGEDSNIQDGAVVHNTGGKSNANIGPRVTVGHRAILHGCIVEGDCLVGMGAILLDNCRVGPWCVIGAGALIAQGKVIPPRSLVMGSPGRVVREVTEAELRWITTSHQVYRETAAINRAAPSL